MRYSSLCALVLALVFPSMSVRPLTLAELCEGSGRVVTGSVKSIESAWNSTHTKIETSIRVEVTETLKGSVTSSVVVKVPGGTVGNVTQHVGDAPVFSSGEKVVCFLRHNEASSEVYGWFRGKFTVIGDAVREMKGTTYSGFRSSILSLCEKR